jgi:hypothetical protein
MRYSLVLVRGVGDIGSAIAHRLFREGYYVVIHDDPKPTTSRRGMAFADAIFEGQAILEGIRTVRSDDPEQVRRAAVAHEVIPVSGAPWKPFLLELAPVVLVDARLRKHNAPDVLRGLADLTVALGPSLVAGRHADAIIETSWDDLGRVIVQGASRPLSGEPRAILGHARDRYAGRRPVPDNALHRRYGSSGAGGREDRVDESRRAARWRASWPDLRRGAGHLAYQGHRGGSARRSGSGQGNRRAATTYRGRGLVCCTGRPGHGGPLRADQNASGAAAMASRSARVYEPRLRKSRSV